MIVDCAYYKDRQRQNDEPLSLERARECMDTGMGFVWLGMKDPTPEEVAQATRAFDVPELAVEEASEVHQRPKLDEHGDHFFGVVKTAWYEETKEEVHFGEIHVFLGPGYVITVRHGEAADLKPARTPSGGASTRICSTPGPRRSSGRSSTRSSDDYEPVVGGIDDDIEEVEQAVFEGGTESTERIYFLKREVIEFHRAVAPLIPPLEAIERGAFPQMPEELRRFFREVARPNAADRRAGQLPARAPDLDPRGEPVADQRPPEPGGAGDLGLGGDHRRAHLLRLDLGDELRAHARAGADATATRSRSS